MLKLSNSSQLKELFLTCVTASHPFIQSCNLNVNTHPMPQSGYCLCGSSVSTSVLFIHLSATVISLNSPNVRNMWSYKCTPPTCLHGAHRTTYLYPSLYLPSLLLLLLLLLGALHNKFAGLILHGVIGFFINIILLAALWLWG